MIEESNSPWCFPVVNVHKPIPKSTRQLRRFIGMATKEFFVQCDASRVGVGWVLYQLDDQNCERSIVFVSPKQNGAQRFRPYIEGLPFRVITDHSRLQWLMSLKDLNSRLARWSLMLQGYDFQMEHSSGVFRGYFGDLKPP